MAAEPHRFGVDPPANTDSTLRDAVRADASDIHLEPWESTLVVRVRLGGVLRELIHLPLELLDKIAGRFKVMANLVSYQTDLPQEGHASTDEDIGVELRISVFPTVRGEKIVVRIFDPRNRSFDLAGLGFEDATLNRTLQHLVDNGVALDKYPISLGPFLEFDPAREVFPDSPEATAMVAREYRAGFVCPTADKV